MNKKKVLQYFWGKLDSGGAETFIINLFTKLNKEKFAVDFLVYEDITYFYNDVIEELGGRVVPLSKREPKFLPWRLIKRWFKLYKLMKDEKYDVFHCNCDFSLKFVELAIAKKAGVKKRICHSHNSAIDTTRVKGKISYCVHVLFRPLIAVYATDYLACSEKAGEWLYGKNFPKNRVIITNNGIDAEYYSFDLDTRKKIRKNICAENDIVIGHIGRFTPIKNQKFIVDIISVAFNRGMSIKAVLIGDGELKKEVEKYSKDKGVSEMITFIGITNKVRDYLMGFDCFVMPSLYEGLPVSGIEAQAAGLPCFFSDTITKDLSITENTHFLSLDDAPEYWLDSIMNCVSSFKRKNEQLSINRNGYDINQVVNSIEIIYMK